MPDRVATRLLTRPELAEAFGTHPQTVYKWEAGGLPIAERGSRGRASRYALSDCVDWFVRRELAARGVTNGARLDPMHERAMLDKARREAVEHALAIKKREYVPIRDVEIHWSRIMVELRNFLRGLPSRIHTQCALPHDATRALAEWIDRALTDLADQHAHEAPDDEEDPLYAHQRKWTSAGFSAQLARSRCARVPGVLNCRTRTSGSWPSWLTRPSSPSTPRTGAASDVGGNRETAPRPIPSPLAPPSKSGTCAAFASVAGDRARVQRSRHVRRGAPRGSRRMAPPSPPRARAARLVGSPQRRLTGECATVVRGARPDISEAEVKGRRVFFQDHAVAAMAPRPVTPAKAAVVTRRRKGKVRPCLRCGRPRWSASPGDRFHAKCRPQGEPEHTLSLYRWSS